MATSYSERDLSLIPDITFSFVESYIKTNKHSSGNKSINKGYKYFSEGYISDIKVHPTSSTDGVKVTGKCYKSQRKTEKPYAIQVKFETVAGETVLQDTRCECAIQLGGCCGHVTGLLYQVANFKKLGLKAIPEDIAKTSLPQTWHMPRGTQITGKPIQDIEVSGYSKRDASDTSQQPKTIKSTLYNPVRGEPLDWEGKHDSLADVSKNLLALPALRNIDEIEKVPSKFGLVPKGCVLSYQQREHEECILNITDGVCFPQLPVLRFMNSNFTYVLSAKDATTLAGLTLPLSDINKFEEKTRDQSNSQLWYKIRRHRLTASNIGRIYKRRKDFETLAQQLQSTRRVTTSAMRHGLSNEPIAAKAYAKAMDDSVNLYPCGVVVSLWSPWIAASPDRKMYNPARVPPFGLLEIKCPVVSSVLEAKYLTKGTDGQLRLKRNHDYYYQMLTQMATCGLEWCDFFVWCQNDHHLETVYFNQDVWDAVKDEVDTFFFSYFI